MMILDVRHCTRFDYSDLVSLSQHVLHLMPRNTDRQQRLSFDLDIRPGPTGSSVGQDYYGNAIHYMSVQEPHRRLIVEARSRIEITPLPGDSAGGPSWEVVADALRSPGPDEIDVQQFIFASPYIAGTPEVAEYAAVSFPPGREIVEGAADLTKRIFTEFTYAGGVSDVSTPVSEVLEMRKGVCQDFAHLQIACLRSLGLAARYVSGYLLTHPPEGQAKRIGADASHAWLAVWTGRGWIDFDPTNNVRPDLEHVTVGWGRDYGDVSPINGFIVGGGAHKIDVGVDVNQAA